MAIFIASLDEDMGNSIDCRERADSGGCSVLRLRDCQKLIQGQHRDRDGPRYIHDIICFFVADTSFFNQQLRAADF